MYTGLLDSGDEMFQELPAFIVLLVLQYNIKLMSADVHYHDPLLYPPLNEEMR